MPNYIKTPEGTGFVHVRYAVVVRYINEDGGGAPAVSLHETEDAAYIDGAETLAGWLVGYEYDGPFASEPDILPEHERQDGEPAADWFKRIAAAWDVHTELGQGVDVVRILGEHMPYVPHISNVDTMWEADDTEELVDPHGCYAFASVTFRTPQDGWMGGVQVRTPGLWGIELGDTQDDSTSDYMREVEAEQMLELADMLRALGFTMEQVREAHNAAAPQNGATDGNEA